MSNIYCHPTVSRSRLKIISLVNVSNYNDRTKVFTSPFFGFNDRLSSDVILQLELIDSDGDSECRWFNVSVMHSC